MKPKIQLLAIAFVAAIGAVTYMAPVSGQKTSASVHAINSLAEIPGPTTAA